MPTGTNRHDRYLTRSLVTPIVNYYYQSLALPHSIDMFKFCPFLVMLALFKQTTSYSKCAWQIHDMKLAPTDVNWYMETVEKGFYHLVHGDCNNCEGEEAFSWMKPTGKSLTSNKKVCYNSDFTTKYGRYQAPVHCTYSRIEDQLCELDLSETDLADKLRWASTVKFISTDNSTYIAGTFCLLGKENLFWILTTRPDHKLKPGLYAELMEQFQALGFNTNNIAKEGTSPYFWHKIELMRCGLKKKHSDFLSSSF